MALEQGTGVAVVGGGVMGAGIAQVAAASGHPVVLADQNEAALDRARESVEAGLATLERKGRLDEGARMAALARIRWTTQIADAASCGLVIEAIVERLEAKRSLFSMLAAIVSPGAVLASNTSSLSIAEIAEAVPNPRRVVGLHFFNPVPLMQLVEVIAAPSSDPAAIDDLVALMRGWGKRPVVARDVPGFIVNRVARPYYAEAFAAFDEAIAAAGIDRALTGAGGFRMGPLALTDLIGQDTNFAVANIVHDAGFGITRFHPQPTQRQLVADGRLGRKAGQGVYDYGAALPAPSLEAPAPSPRRVLLREADTPLGLLCPAATFEINPGVPQGIALLDDVRVALSDGRPLSARADADVLLDIVRDPSKADTVLFAASDDRSAALVAGWIQAGERSALRIPDRPGLLVLRTLAQIANAAADTVLDEITDAAGVDEAMVYGANHPEGPMAWAQRYGFAQLTRTLENIAAATGDPIYDPSHGLQARQTA